MARRYNVFGSDTNTASTTILALTSAATIRPRIYDLLLSSDATPADNAGNYSLKRYTAAGTATAVTPVALDPADPAALASAGKAHSAEPTYTAASDVLGPFAVNQRPTFRWVAYPEAEIVLPATAANGVGLLVNAIAGSAVNVVVGFHYAE